MNSNLSSIGSTDISWTTQQEVGPGDGRSILAVVLIQLSFLDITGIVGYLTPPLGFSATTGNSMASNNPTSVNLNQNQKTQLAAITTTTTTAATTTIHCKFE